MSSLRRKLFRAAVPCCLFAAATFIVATTDGRANVVDAEKPREKLQKYNLSREAIPIKLSDVTSLSDDASSFRAGHSSKQGWAIKVAKNNPRTPDAGEGVVVVGGGKSYDIFGIDAETGERRWKAKSKDSGISSISVSGKAAYYTTWSCTLERVRLTDGKVEFVKWIASTVECAPHAEGNRVAAAYTQDGNQVSMHSIKSGNSIWSKKLKSPVLTAPVIHGDDVYTTSTDGRVSKLDSKSGDIDWSIKMGAVSTPVITKWGLLVATPKIGKAGDPAKKAEPKDKSDRKNDKSSRESVVHEKTAKKGTLVETNDRRIVLIDPARKPAKFKGKMPVKPSTTGNLDYQGIAPGVGEDSIIFAYNGEVVAIDPVKSKQLWRVKTGGTSNFVTPIVYDGLVIIARKDGVISALEERTGELVWSYKFEDRVFCASPCVYEHRVFITTRSGELLSIPTGADEADNKVASGIASNPAEDGCPPGEKDIPEGQVGEKAADRWAKARDAFRKEQKKVRSQKNKDKPAKPDAPATKPDPVERPQANDPAEELTKDAWGRREERRAKRNRPNGRKYEKKPYPR